MTVPEGYLTMAEAAAALGVSTRTIARMYDAGDLTGCRTSEPGGDRRIDPASLRPRAPRDLAPCGTYAAARRHQRRHERMDRACRDALNAYRRGMNR